MATAIKKYPIHPLLFAFSPLLLMLAHNTNPLQLGGVLRDGGLWLAGGLAWYALLWAVTRQPQRAALLASLGLLFFFAYDPAYELVRGQELLGWTYGKHRFLLPVWAGVLAVSGYAIVRRLERPQRLTPVYSVTGLIVLALGLAGVLVTGVWEPALRTAGVLPPPQVEVTYIDVGHVGPDEAGVVGEAILIQTSEGKNALIDGGYPNRLVLETLQARGVTRLDLVVLTHAHDDHTGGLIDVLQSIPVDRMVHNGQSLDSPVYREFEAAVRSAGIELQVVRSGDLLPLGSLTFEVLSPRLINPNSINNNSIVLAFLTGRVAFLFTGDTDRLEETRLLESGQTRHIDILKLAHHGADSSSLPDYIAAIAPEVAIYSVGAGNSYGFPHDVTLATLRAVGAAIYGTDVNGTIIVRTDGRTYDVLPERGEPR